jgi:drug/metabolite transporter (DMT)-like permease
MRKESMQAISYSPYISLLVIVGLLGTVTPVMKSVFVASQVNPVSVAALRTLVAFVILFPVAACRDLRALVNLSRRDVIELSLLGSLGLGSYLLAATGLKYTTVTHYVLLYSLLPAWTALFMALLRYRRLTLPVVAGIGLSMVGCTLAVTINSHSLDTTLLAGDGLVLLFTIMMALYPVASRNITSRIGTLPANAVMFGSTAFFDDCRSRDVCNTSGRRLHRVDVDGAGVHWWGDRAGLCVERPCAEGSAPHDRGIIS